MADIPDLSRMQRPQPAAQQRLDPETPIPHSGNLAVMPRHVGADNIVGHYKPGQLPRAAFMDAEQLLAAIQGVVRHENRVSEARRAGVPFEGAEYDYLTPCSVAACGRPRSGVQTIGLGEGGDLIALTINLCEEHAALLSAVGEPIVTASEPPATAPLVLG